MKFPEIFKTLLEERGIAEEESADFLNPDYEKLLDPLLLPDMERARDRVLEAIEGNEHIVIFSDYDADGIPGAVVLSDFFRRIGYGNISFYIPHRHDEGFGLNTQAIDEIRDRSAKLMITIDCGTADPEEVNYAAKSGIDVVITDHHETSVLPKALAVVNPKRKDAPYPFKELCGSALAYKLVQAILDKRSFGLKPGVEKWSLDMVGIATLADCVPLVGENRILARFGLEVLKKSPRPGLQALFKKLKLEQKYISEDDVAFMITPRLNAASRMGVPEDAFRLLSTADPDEAETLVQRLEEVNRERKSAVATMVKEAKRHLAARGKLSEVILVGNPEWRPALAGLVANSLVEEYTRPVFVWGRDGDGVLKGSCRTYNGSDLHALMTQVGDSFLEFGGHAGAGGFSIALEDLSTLEEKLSLALVSLPVDTGCLQDSRHPVSIRLEDIGEELWSTVSAFAPFGTGNEKPVFKILNVPVQAMRQFGKANEHLELTLDRNLKAISFFASAGTYNLGPGSYSCTLLAHLEKSFFRSRPELRLRIVDITGL